MEETKIPTFRNAHLLITLFVHNFSGKKNNKNLNLRAGFSADVQTITPDAWGAKSFSNHWGRPT